MKSRKARIPWLAGVALVAVGMFVLISAIGAENPQTNGDPSRGSANQEQPGSEALEVTDGTAPGAAMAVTDTTAALSSDATGASTTGQTTSTSTTTTLASTTSTTTAASRLPPRTQHPDWDNRLPGTREGIMATECHTTFRVPIYDPPLFWDFYYVMYSGTFGFKEERLIGFTLSDSSWEPAPGSDLHKALASLWVASAQERRDRGEAAMDVRWYAWFVTREINKYGNPEHPSCASILPEGTLVLPPISSPVPKPSSP